MNRSATAASRHGPTRHRGSARHSRLVSYLAVGYTLLVAYASLYPFRTWRGPTDGAFSFLLAPWPRYYTFFDLLVNVLAYVPLGFLFALAALPYLAPRWAALAAILRRDRAEPGRGGGAGIHTRARVLQSGPAQQRPRGHAGGAAGGDDGGALDPERAISIACASTCSCRARRSTWASSCCCCGCSRSSTPRCGCSATAICATWCTLAANLDFSPATYRWIETGVTAFNLAGICLLTLALARPGQSLAGPLLALVSAALALKSVAALTLFKPGDAALWLTPGSMLGIPAGLLLYLVLAQLPRWGVTLCAACPDPGGRRAVERCSGEPVYTGFDHDLALRALPELQRPHAAGLQRVAARRLRRTWSGSCGRASAPGLTTLREYTMLDECSCTSPAKASA